MARAAGALCAALAGLGHEVTVFAAEGEGEDEPHPGVTVRRFPGPRWLAGKLVPFARGLGDAILTERRSFDVAHLHGHRSGMARQAARALRRAGVPWVLQPHGTFPHHGRERAAKAVWDAAGGLAAIDGASALLALSEAEARDLPGRAVVVGSGVAAPGPPPAARGPSASRLVFVGSDAPQKRARALAGLLDAIPEARLDLVGPVGADLVAAFARFGDRVRAHGALADAALCAALAAADLVVHPAVGEAFGLAPFEAALVGTPGVVAGGHGCGEWYGRAGGCVVPPDDPAALAAAVRARLASPALAAGECGRVREFARRELTWEAAAARVAEVYARVAGAREARAR
jgi:glycosyltransferase involved in cell wall biosynthesis